MNQSQHQQHEKNQQQQQMASFPPWMLSPQQPIAFVLTPINTLNFNQNHTQNNNHNNNNNNNNNNITSSFPLNLPTLTINHPDPDPNGSNTPETVITDAQSIISEANQTIASSISPNIITPSNNPFNASPISLKNNKKKNQCSSSFGINDTDNTSTKQSRYEQSPIHREPQSDPEPISEDDDDDDLYIPSNDKNYRKTRKHKKSHKSRKKSRRPCSKSLTSRSSQPIQRVSPASDGDGSISWSDLCRIDFKCHICNKRYIGSSARTKYVECLKTHYQSKDNDLEYLKCELCLKNPTPKAQQLLIANKKERGSIDYDPDKWRKSSHIANFVSHLAGHPENEPGFHCKVKIYDCKTDKFIACSAAATTPQNLAKHIYGMHYEPADKEKKYTITAGKGYVARNGSKITKLTKQIKPKKRKTYNKKRKLSKIKEEEKKEENCDNDDIFNIKEPDFKRQKLNTGNKNGLPPKPLPPVPPPRTFNDDNLSLLLPESVGKRCYSISDQTLFLTKLITAATLNLNDLDDLDGLFGGKPLEN